MMKQLAILCFMAMLLIGADSASVQAQDRNPFTLTLTGISAVFVVIEQLPDSAKAIGLTKEMIQTDVELKLRLAGMDVKTPEEGKKLLGRPFVFVAISMTDYAKAASVTVELDQDTVLSRNGAYAPSAQTWTTGFVIANPDAQTVRSTTKDLIDQFLNAWLSVNPKK